MDGDWVGREGQAWRREARRILSQLGDGCLQSRARGLAVCARPGARARAWTDAKMAAAMAEAGWIARDDQQHWRLTRAGAAFAACENEAFRDQHGEVENGADGTRVERAGSPLEFLKRHTDGDGAPFLDAHACAAADRLQHDFDLAQLRPRLTGRLGDPKVDGSRASDAGERVGAAMDARRRCLAAFDAAGPVLGDLLFDTVCLARGLNEAERGFGLPQRSAKVFLRIALQRLAGHYGLVSGQRRGGRIEAWRAEA